jgi:hypothetical protein
MHYIGFGRARACHDQGLTKRCSQPLAGMSSHFNFMKPLSILAKLALASGG